VDVLQLTNVDEILGFHKAGEQLEMIGDVWFLGTQGEILFFGWNELAFSLEDQTLVLIVLESVD